MYYELLISHIVYQSAQKPITIKQERQRIFAFDNKRDDPSVYLETIPNKRMMHRSQTSEKQRLKHRNFKNKFPHFFQEDSAGLETMLIKYKTNMLNKTKDSARTASELSRHGKSEEKVRRGTGPLSKTTLK